MAYEVTATRRRPKTFEELVGQEFVATTLKSSIESGRIAHAYLFSGPRGCGKTSAARILARSLNCVKGPTAAPCGTCSSCQEISRGASLDVIEIDGASNTSVNDVRQIKDEVLFPPNAGRYKVYIIDEVHMLSNSAFNALLKTIEEPPPYIVFVFATTELHKVPATIKSRCQQFSFRLISIETITAILRNACKEMGIQGEDEALFWIAKESTGSLRDAYTLFDQVASFSDGNIRSALIREKLGLVGLDKLNALAEACAVNDTAAAFAMIDEILEAGVAIEQFVIDLAGYYRSLLLLKNSVTRESLLGYAPDRFSPTVLSAMDSIRLERALDILLTLYRDIRYSVSPRFELETAVSKLSWLTRWIPPPELRAAIMSARDALGTSSLGTSSQRTFSQGFGRLGFETPGGGKKNDPGGGLSGNAGLRGAALVPGNSGAEAGASAGRDNWMSRQNASDNPLDMGKPGSLAEEFKRRMSAREFAKKDENHKEADSSLDGGSGKEAGGSSENRIIEDAGSQSDAGPQADASLPAAPGGTELPGGDEVPTDVPPEAEMVRQFFNGDIVAIYPKANGGESAAL
ncbi:MAG: DNA polymerase III subunit gamma/tau [Treponema sp.]|jgi:DNA polymerase-3 subunit gamma/tau|nr:DNA polymerase III subunit gamma/tau [Treponema sp.]